MTSRCRTLALVRMRRRTYESVTTPQSWHCRFLQLSATPALLVLTRLLIYPSIFFVQFFPTVPGRGIFHSAPYNHHDDHRHTPHFPSLNWFSPTFTLFSDLSPSLHFPRMKNLFLYQAFALRIRIKITLSHFSVDRTTSLCTNKMNIFLSVCLLFCSSRLHRIFMLWVL